MTDTRVLSLTTHARIAVGIARGVAASVGDHDLTPAHVALGVLRELENPAVAALWRACVPIPVLRWEIEHQLQSEAEHRGPRRQRPGDVILPSTPGEQRMLELASAEARLRNDPYVGTEHLLLAILRDPDTSVARAFARHGVGFESAVTHLQQVFTEESGPPSPHASVGEIQAYIEQNPDSPYGWPMLARKHFWRGDLQAAREAYERLIALDPGWMANHEYDRETWEQVRGAA